MKIKNPSKKIAAAEARDGSAAFANARNNVLSKNQICQLLEMSAAKFERLARDGAPMERGEGSRDAFSVHVPAFVNFMIEDAVRKAVGDREEPDDMSFDAAKRKDKAVQANIREIELQKLQGRIVDIEDVRPVLREAFSTVRSRILSVSTQVVGLSAQQRREMEDAINDALADLSEGRIGAWNPDAGEAATQPKH